MVRWSSTWGKTRHSSRAMAHSQSNADGAGRAHGRHALGSHTLPALPCRPILPDRRRPVRNRSCPHPSLQAAAPAQQRPLTRREGTRLNVHHPKRAHHMALAGYLLAVEAGQRQRQRQRWQHQRLCHATCDTHRQIQHRTWRVLCNNAAGGANGSLQGRAGAAARLSAL